MANIWDWVTGQYWVDTALGTGGDDGSTPSDAKRGTSAIKTGFEVDHAAGIACVIRRTSAYDEGIVGFNADIALTANGTPALPVVFLSWPRAAIPNTTITEADWTNGSQIVDNVVGITPSWRGHLARWATAPDGHKYLLTAILVKFTVDGMGHGDEFEVGEILTNTTQTKKGKVWKFIDNLDTTGTIWAVVDSSSAWVDDDNITSDGGGDAELSANAIAVGFLIDREYAGGTVTGVNGKFQIDEDPDYVNRPQAGIDAGWDADSHDLPIIDFNNEAYQLNITTDRYIIVSGFNVKDSADMDGIIFSRSNLYTLIKNCLFKQSSSNTPIVGMRLDSTTINNCIIEGSGTGTSQTGINTVSGSIVNLNNIALYNCGKFGIKVLGKYNIVNSNFGIEMSNGDSEIRLDTPAGLVKGMDVKFGGSNGYIEYTNISEGIFIENYQKILGNHKSFYNSFGEGESVAVTSTNANKKLSDKVLKISPNINSVFVVNEWKKELFVGNFDLNVGAHTIKYWIYNDTGDTLNDNHATENIYLEGKYIDSYDDTTTYTITNVFSTEIDIIQATDADAWVQISLAFTLATAGRIKVYLKVAKYEATGYILLDPIAVIT